MDDIVGKSSIQYSPDGKIIYFSRTAAGIHSYGILLTKVKKIKKLSDIEGGIENFGISPDGKKLFRAAHRAW